MKNLFLTILVCASSAVLAEEREPSRFRVFTDKKEKQIAARILSISEDRTTMEMERQDGALFHMPITILSLGDQQFIRDWLNPPPPSGGRVQVFGKLPKDQPIDVSALKGIDDVETVHAMKFGWLVRRSSGEVIAFGDRYEGLGGVKQIAANTVWLAMTNRDGTVSNGLRKHFPDILTNAVQCVAGGGHHAALLEGGEVKVWGNGYKYSEPTSLTKTLPPIVRLASSQGAICAVDADGVVHGWNVKATEFFEAPIGDGVVEIQGSIFTFLARTKSGEVYEWSSANPEKAKVPAVIADKGPFLQVRCNGATRAVQKEDRSWIAWGRNSSGIVDHINNLGPVRDLAFFSEPGSQENGYVIWIEP
ncbi:MAG: hypothetical protein P1U87_12920 [Verrucomicrobiales bacterium]|nr:hypothetical protein [Verrucomicrobiales bacterium]